MQADQVMKCGWFSHLKGPSETLAPPGCTLTPAWSLLLLFPLVCPFRLAASLITARRHLLSGSSCAVSHLDLFRSLEPSLSFNILLRLPPPHPSPPLSPTLHPPAAVRLAVSLVSPLCVCLTSYSCPHVPVTSPEAALSAALPELGGGPAPAVMVAYLINQARESQPGGGGGGSGRPLPLGWSAHLQAGFEGDE